MFLFGNKDGLVKALLGRATLNDWLVVLAACRQQAERDGERRVRPVSGSGGR